MVNLCRYKNILGEPGKGVHSIRFFDVAIVDVILTVVGAKVFHVLLKTKLNKDVKFLNILVGFFILGVISHRLFCVNTTLDKLLFNSGKL